MSETENKEKRDLTKDALIRRKFDQNLQKAQQLKNLEKAKQLLEENVELLTKHSALFGPAEENPLKEALIRNQGQYEEIRGELNQQILQWNELFQAQDWVGLQNSCDIIEEKVKTRGIPEFTSKIEKCKKRIQQNQKLFKEVQHLSEINPAELEPLRLQTHFLALDKLYENYHSDPEGKVNYHPEIVELLETMRVEVLELMESKGIEKPKSAFKTKLSERFNTFKKSIDAAGKLTKWRMIITSANMTRELPKRKQMFIESEKIAEQKPDIFENSKREEIRQKIKAIDITIEELHKKTDAVLDEIGQPLKLGQFREVIQKLEGYRREMKQNGIDDCARKLEEVIHFATENDRIATQIDSIRKIFTAEEYARIIDLQTELENKIQQTPPSLLSGWNLTRWKEFKEEFIKKFDQDQSQTEGALQNLEQDLAISLNFEEIKSQIDQYQAILSKKGFTKLQTVLDRIRTRFKVNAELYERYLLWHKKLNRQLYSDLQKEIQDTLETIVVWGEPLPEYFPHLIQLIQNLQQSVVTGIETEITKLQEFLKQIEQKQKATTDFDDLAQILRDLDAEHYRITQLQQPELTAEYDRIEHRLKQILAESVRPTPKDEWQNLAPESITPGPDSTKTTEMKFTPEMDSLFKEAEEYIAQGQESMARISYEYILRMAEKARNQPVIDFITEKMRLL
jgi:hypothetical protein